MLVIPTKKEIIDINKKIVRSRTDPNDNEIYAGIFVNESSLDYALDPYEDYQSAFEAAYGFAVAIAGGSAFWNGNKRTAAEVVMKICTDNGYVFNGNNDSLLKLVDSLVKTDGDTYDSEEERQNFISKISNLFHE